MIPANAHSRLNIPKFLYGTAWKEEQTESLVIEALKAGFTGIDTANQRKHYFEEAVGNGIQQFLSQSSTPRKDLFIQTKFTYARGQDHRKPYNEKDSFTQQVNDSFASSCKNLKMSEVDSLILHGPYGPSEFSAEDKETWTAMESLKNSQSVTFLGVSNINPRQLRALLDFSTISPTFVQNRCYASTGWDYEVRAICTENNILYQGFSLLTANRKELSTPAVAQIAARHKKTIPQVIFKFCQQVDMICLTGTSNPQHMKEDLAISDFQLSESEVRTIEALGSQMNR